MFARFFLGCFLSLLFLSLPNGVLAEGPIKIGANIGLTGNVARYGEWGRRGIDLALEEVNSAGGIRGRRIKVIYEDSEGKPAKAISAYQKLKSLNQVDFVLTYQSSIALAVAPLANRDRVVQIDFSATTPSYSSADDFTFRTGVLATQLAADSAELLSKHFGVSRVGCLYIENDFGQGMFDVFEENFSGEIAVSESFRSDASDYRVQLLRLKKAKVDHVWLVGHLRESGLILRQARDLGLKARFYSDVYSIEGPDFLTAAEQAGEGVVYLAPKFDSGSSAPVIASFVDRYTNVYGEVPSYFAAQAYDAVLALTKALHECDEPSPECVKMRLYELEFEGASGAIDFDRNGDVKKQVAWREVRGGEFANWQRG